jgi:hypothetical protein
MTRLRKTFVVAGATAAVAMVAALIETPYAQNSDARGDLAKSLMETGDSPNPAIKKKADAAMTVPNSTPITDADKKAAAAMGMGSSPSPTK